MKIAVIITVPIDTIANKDLQEKITSREMLVIKPLDKNLIYSFLCSFKDIDLTDKLACQRLVDMFINKVVLYDKYCEIYLNTNGDKSKQLKLKEQPDIDSEILFESKKKEQSKLKSSDYSLMADSMRPQLNTFYLAMKTYRIRLPTNRMLNSHPIF